MLSHATCATITRIGFPADESVQSGGWDGVLVVDNGNAFVPSGTSVWEIGANRDVKGKADDDYDKRSGEPGSTNPKEATFVFVTPRVWANKGEWADEKRATGVWRDVRVYDADDLAQWLETAPSVHVWFSRLIGKYPEGATDMVTWWSEWAEATGPPISENLMTAGRDRHVEELQTWLRTAEASSVAVVDNTKQEALAFFLAVLNKIPVEERIAYIARGVIVYDLPAWQQLLTSAYPLVLVPFFDDVAGVGLAVKKGHHVIVPRDTRGRSTRSIEVSRLRREPAEKALREMGLSEAQSRIYATLARRSLNAFRRKIANGAEFMTPTWALPEHAAEILPALLAGTWDDGNANDRKVIEELAGPGYNVVSTALTRWLNESDAPVRRVGNTWMVVSKDDAWKLLCRFLTRDILERMQSVALAVLGIADPKFELPPDQQFMAGALGKARPYSGLLCKGLADTVAIMGSRNSTFTDGTTGQEWADRLVSRLLDQAKDDWHVWASLSDCLPLLAEAAPNVFLDAVSKGCAGDNAVLKQLMVTAEDDRWFFSGRPQTGLLWALENLAWSAEHLGRAALSLAKLTTFEVNPDPSYLNRPQKSLRDIFICWRPHTAATFEDRLRVIDLLRNREPVISWVLLLRILPEHEDSVSSTHTPDWRDWVPDPRPRISPVERWNAAVEISHRVLADIGLDGRRWSDVISRIYRLVPESVGEFLGLLREIDPDVFDVPERLLVWGKLRELISRHREFEGEDWALPTDIVDQLEEAYHRFTPHDIVSKYSWLFVGYPSLLRPAGMDWHMRDSALTRERQSTTQSIYAENGLAGLIALAKRADRPFEIGSIVGECGCLADEDRVNAFTGLFSDERAIEVFARGFIAAQIQQRGAEWIDTQLGSAAATQWSAEQKARFFTCLPFEKLTWDRVDCEAIEIQAGYWRHVGIGWLPDTDEYKQVAEKLLSYARPYDCIFLLHRYLRQSTQLSVDVLVRALESVAQTTMPEQMDHPQFAHVVGELFDYLGKHTGDVDEGQHARLEWLFFPILAYSHRGTQVLQREITRNPQFFVELITVAFGSENEDPKEYTQDEINAAMRVNALLEQWKTVPGASEEGNVDPQALREWMQQARDGAKAVGRLQAADMIIGRVLAFAPVGKDRVWPDVAVRDLLEEANSSTMGHYRKVCG